MRTPVLDVDATELADLLTESHATFVRRDVVRALAQAATQGASLDELEQGADAMLAGPYAVAVAEGRWTTPEMLALERRTVELAMLPAPPAGCSAPGNIERALDARPSLGSDQRQVVATITGSGRPIDIVIGPAGTGKTFSLDAGREAWESSGYRVLGTSLAARAAAELQNGAGIASQTIDRLRNRMATGYERLDERSVLVIDEAGMVGTRRLAAMIEEARAARAKVVLVGDPKQLPENDAGGLLAALAHRLGHAELTENRRQRDPEERAVVAELRLGHVEAAMDCMQRHGSVITADNADQLRDGLVGDWYAARAGGDDVLMVAARRSTVADLNDRARELLAARGELGEEVLDVRGMSFAPGPRQPLSTTSHRRELTCESDRATTRRHLREAGDRGAVRLHRAPDRGVGRRPAGHARGPRPSAAHDVRGGGQGHVRHEGPPGRPPSGMAARATGPVAGPDPVLGGDGGGRARRHRRGVRRLEAVP
ncbi:MAG: AAA family ATPase [Acidimicrobiales bacterium]